MILLLRGATGWTAAETARRFVVSGDTIASWMKRLDEQGPRALAKAPVVTNKFPEYVAELVRRLRALQPSLGKVRVVREARCEAALRRGRRASIAVLERSFRSLKTEMLRKLPWVPLTRRKLAAEVAAYMGWYEGHRPHQGLGGRTPEEVRSGVKPAREQRRMETRAGYPLRDKRAENKARRVKGELVIVVEHFQGRPHLLVVSLRRAA